MWIQQLEEASVFHVFLELEVGGWIEKEQQRSQPLETWIKQLTSGYSFAGNQVSCRVSGQNDP